MDDLLLDVREVSLKFGGLAVLTDVNLSVARGNIHGLIGPNGAGKTSLFNCISGLYRADTGQIRLDGDDLLRLPPYRLAERGLARTFQHPTLDPHITVLENTMAGAHTVMRGGFFGSSLRLPSIRHDEKRLRSEALAWLEWAGLADHKDEHPGSLPYGSQKLIELARGMVSKPKLLMLDEPAGGLSHGEVDRLGDLISTLPNEHGTTVLLVEHHMGFVGRITDKVDILVEGRNVMTGTAAEAKADPAVIEAYLGQPV